MKFQDQTQIQITQMDHTGYGLGHVNTREALVGKTIPGETIIGSLMKRRKGQLVLKLEELIIKADSRVTPKCKFANVCGGCAWQHIDYPAQLKIKADLLNNYFIQANVPVKIDSVMPAVKIFYHRNRMDYCIGPKGEVGLKEPMSWNRYIDLAECHLMSPDAVNLMGIFRQYLRKNNLVGWDAKQNTGNFRYLVIREGKNTGERMVNIITKTPILEDQAYLVEQLAKHCTTIYHGVNVEVTDLSITNNLKLIHGKPLLKEKVGENSFNIHPNSFFQTNSGMAEQLFYSVKEMVKIIKPTNILDLYCGVGFFAIGLKDMAKNLYGVEIDATAIDMAKLNAKENQVTNITFTAAKSEDLTWQNLPADLVIIDPPRSGLHPKVIKTLLEMLPENIIYVSCNYRRFGEEWKLFDKNYTINNIQAFDLFPHSPHVEIVSWLTKK